MMILETLTVGMFAANCYLVGCPDTKEGVVIDPGAEGRRIIEKVRELELKVKYIINTHGHIDHIGANGRLKEILRAEILIHEQELDLYRNPGFGLGLVTRRQPPPDRLIRGGERIGFGSMEIEVVETPGHTRGGICLHLDGVIFTGDTLFAGSVGRTDLTGGSVKDLLKSIREQLLTLPPGTVIYPGHGPVSTIKEEARSNPFIR